MHQLRECQFSYLYKELQRQFTFMRKIFLMFLYYQVYLVTVIKL